MSNRTVPRVAYPVLSGLGLVATVAAILHHRETRSVDAPGEASAAPSPSSVSVTAPPSQLPHPLSASVAPSSLVNPYRALSRAQANDFAKQAERCWDDVGCGLEAGEQLYLAADEGGATELNCLYFYYGRGVPKDPKRARACFERVGMCGPARSNRSMPPDLLSPMYLAAMLLRGEAGPREPERAKQILDTCLTHGDGLEDPGDPEALVHEADRFDPAAHFDVCEQVGGTSMFTHHCMEFRGALKAFEGQRALRLFAGPLDSTGRKLVKKANVAFERFCFDSSIAYGDLSRGALVESRLVYQAGAYASAQAERTALLQSLMPNAPEETRADDTEVGEAFNRLLKSAPDAQQRKLLTDAQASWNAYRDAEVAFIVHVLGKRHDTELAGPDIRGRLAKRRLRELEEFRAER